MTRMLSYAPLLWLARQLAAAVVLALFTLQAAAGEPAALEHFETKVRPLFAKHCWKCHGEKKAESGLRLDTAQGVRQGGGSGPAVVAGKPEESLLLQAVRQSGDLKMPPDGKLKPQQIDDLTAWIRDGAVWPSGDATPAQSSGSTIADAHKRHWAFQPVRPQPLPAVKNRSWVKSPIDYFILAKLEKNGLKPSPAADRWTLLRRLTFDLTGLPPTPQEMEAFVRDDSPDAFAHAVERLLASPRYGEHWGRHWMDVVRYADTAGDNADYPVPEAGLYRDYIIDSFNADKPYDQFAREQLAGDILARQRLESEMSNLKSEISNFAEQIVATGFLALSRRYATAPYEFMHLTIEDTIDTTGRAFVGLTLRCARCHDHKYDPITRDDYYALYGFFASTQFPYAGSEEFASKSFPRASFVPLVPPQEAESRMSEYRRSMEALRAEIKKHEQAAKDADAAKKRDLEQHLVRLRSELRRLERWGAPLEMPVAYAVSDGKPVDESIHLRGEPEERGPVVPRGVPKFLAGGAVLNIPQGASGRLQLAQWLTRPENPLTARVMVNRIWQHHFGRGLVNTPSNFGLRGEPPSHPELLDYLADYFVRHGWSIKAMHRLILNSATWQQTSNTPAPTTCGDALFAGFARRRLDAEAIRDAMMFAAGTLRLDRPGPHPFPDVSAWGWTQHSPFKEVYDSPHRSVYLMRQRIQRHPYLALFDAPDANVTTDMRTSATVPLQALYLLNNPFVREQAAALARRVLAGPSTTGDRIRLACELA